MPNIKSAKKRVKVSARKKEENLKVRGAMKTAIKKTVKDLNEDNIQDSFKKIDKAVKKGIVKKNNAARQKSKLVKKLNKVK